MDHYAEYSWVLGCGIVLAMFVAYVIGANSISNAFASSVGARTLSVPVAAALAAVCEFAGAALMGAGVTHTISSNITNLSTYKATPDLLIYGMLCALLAVGLWLALASYFELPASPTYCVVGAVVGMSLIINGGNSIQWSAHSDQFPKLQGISAIAIFWVVAPILSGLFAIALGLVTRFIAMQRERSFMISLWLLPVYAFIVFWTIGYSTSELLPLTGATSAAEQPWLAALMCVAGGMVIAVVATGFVRDAVLSKVAAAAGAAAEQNSAQAENGLSRSEKAADAPGADALDAVARDAPAGGGAADFEVAAPSPAEMRAAGAWRWLIAGATYDVHDALESSTAWDATITEAPAVVVDATSESLRYLQVFTACATSFAHGSNELAAAVGPLAAMYAAWRCTCVSAGPNVAEWVLLVGGVFTAVGACSYGLRALRGTAGRVPVLTSSRAHCVELGAALTVLLCSRYGLPVSMANCAVGALSGLALLEGARGYNYGIHLRMAAGWVGAVAVAGVTAAAFAAQGVYAPSRYASEHMLSLGLALNTSAYNVSLAIAAYGAAGNNTLNTQAYLLQNQTINLTKPITSIVDPLDTLQTGFKFLLADTYFVA